MFRRSSELSLYENLSRVLTHDLPMTPAENRQEVCEGRVRAFLNLNVQKICLFTGLATRLYRVGQAKLLFLKLFFNYSNKCLRHNGCITLYLFL